MATMSAKAKDECPQCKKRVQNNDMALMCEICEDWYHVKCQGLSEDEYKFLGDHKSLLLVLQHLQ